MISDRMLVWFTPNLLASNSMLLERLETLAAEYDAGGLTVGRLDEILLESDKIQAELWRRTIHNLPLLGGDSL